MATQNNVFLVGPMGAGKTTIGRLLAAELRMEFLDTDKAIEQRCGADIPWIFDVEGEAGFREREVAMVEELSQRTGIVLATGGGAVLRPENRRALVSRGQVVYLRASVDQQMERTAKDRSRPLLQTDDPQRVLQHLMEIRDPLYAEVADIVVDTDGRQPRDVAKQIARELADG